MYASVVIIDFGGLLRWRGCHDDERTPLLMLPQDFPAVLEPKRSRAENRGKSSSMSEPDNAIPATNVVLWYEQHKYLFIICKQYPFGGHLDDVVDYLQRTEEITPHPPDNIGAYNNNDFVHHPRRLRHYCQYPCTTTNSRKYNTNNRR